MKFSLIQGAVFLILLTVITPTAGQGFDPRTANEQLSRWLTEDIARQRARARAREDAEDQALKEGLDFSQFATPAESLPHSRNNSSGAIRCTTIGLGDGDSVTNCN